MADIPAKSTVEPAKEKPPRDPDLSMRHLHAPGPMKLNISFHISDPAPTTTAPGSENPFASALPEESMKRLRAMEPQLLEWLEASDANRELFLGNPVAAMQQVDKKSDITFLKRLRRARRRMPPDQEMDSRVRLSEVHVAVVHKPVSKRPATAAAESAPKN